MILNSEFGTGNTSLNNAKLFSDQISGLQAAIGALPDDASVKALCQSFLDDAVRVFSELQCEYPLAYEQAARLAVYLTSVASCLSGHYASVLQDQAQKAGENRRNANAVTELYVDVARAKAAAFWDADSSRQEFSLSDVSKQVHEIMLREGFSRKSQLGHETLSVSAVRGWIAPLAPEYARRPGRRGARL